MEASGPHPVLRLISARVPQECVEYMELADHLLDRVEDGAFELHLYPQAKALELLRSD